MAKTYAYCVGEDAGRVKQVHRLGSVSATGGAQTWRTFATVYVLADGSGQVCVRRDGETLLSWEFGPEGSILERVERPLT